MGELQRWPSPFSWDGVYGQVFPITLPMTPWDLERRIAKLRSEIRAERPRRRTKAFLKRRAKAMAGRKAAHIGRRS